MSAKNNIDNPQAIRPNMYATKEHLSHFLAEMSAEVSMLFLKIHWFALRKKIGFENKKRIYYDENIQK